MIQGRPGSEPFPLRLRSFAVIGEAYMQLDRAAFWAVLREPPDNLRILSWATSAQRQHHLHARLCTPPLLHVGSDDGCISVDTLATADLASALTVLRSGPKAKAVCTRAEILTGAYRPQTVMALGAAVWLECEHAVAPHRGSPLLRLFVEHCPVSDASHTTERPVLDATDARIVTLLGAVAKRSGLREADPIHFWGGVFLRRLQRHAHRPLPQFLSRLILDLQVDPSGDVATEIADVLHTMIDAEQEALMKRLQERAAVLVALTYDARQTRQTRKAVT